MEMLSLKQAKMIDQGNKDLVFGYVRKVNDSLSSTIPIMINYICLLYYYLIPEKFIEFPPKYMQTTTSDEHNDSKDDIVTIIEWCPWSNIHGNVIINAKDNPNVIAIWRMKVEADSCFIGIHSMYGNDKVCFGYGYQKGWEQTKMSPNYSWGGTRAMISHIEGNYGMDMFKRGDAITLRLDLSTRKLNFYKNAEETNIVFNNIDTSTNYHLMIRTNESTQSSFQIIDFDIKHYHSLSFHSK